MPYNYLLTRKFLSGNGLKIENTIIILDEAHNVENNAQEG
jgi:hypothetical protein